MSGDGKRGVGHWPQANAPILDSTETDLGSFGSNGRSNLLSGPDATNRLRQRRAKLGHPSALKTVRSSCRLSVRLARVTHAVPTDQALYSALLRQQYRLAGRLTNCAIIACAGWRSTNRTAPPPSPSPTAILNPSKSTSPRVLPPRPPFTP